MAATTVMIDALDGGTIKADNDATLNQPGQSGGPKAQPLGRRSVSRALQFDTRAISPLVSSLCSSIHFLPHSGRRGEFKTRPYDVVLFA